jgi:RNA 2',3'-cyclic 3'-phosphodiesterase
MPASLRSFIAAELPAELAGALGRLQADLGAAGVRARWVRPERIHLTLRFLGQVPVETVARLAEALAAAADGQPALRLRALGLGVFPGPRRPRVVWVGLAGETEAFGSLQRRLEQALAARGIPPEGRPFRAHLTLGRFAETGSPGPVAEALGVHSGRELGRFDLRELVLFKSELRPAGAVYTALARAGLDGARPDNPA